MADEVEAVLDEPEYESLSVVSIRTQYGGIDPFTEAETVTVTLARSANASYPRLSARLYERIAAATGPDVTVGVQFSSYQRTSSQEGNSAARSSQGRSALDWAKRVDLPTVDSRSPLSKRAVSSAPSYPS